MVLTPIRHIFIFTVSTEIFPVLQEPEILSGTARQ
jgi:hypothetical protein